MQSDWLKTRLKMASLLCISRLLPIRLHNWPMFSVSTSHCQDGGCSEEDYAIWLHGWNQVFSLLTPFFERFFSANDRTMKRVKYYLFYIIYHHHYLFLYNSLYFSNNFDQINRALITRVYCILKFLKLNFA